MVDALQYEPRIAVLADPGGDGALLERAEAVARGLGLERVNLRQTAAFDVVVGVTREGLDLRVPPEAVARLPAAFAGITGGRPVRIELTALDTASGPGRRLGQPLYKAVGIRKGDLFRPRVADLTAGYGEDSYLLASVGCRVTAVERHPVVAALLEDAVRRAGEADPGLAERLVAIHADGSALCQPIGGVEVDVVYLDPMFPGGSSRKAAERKPMRLLRLLVGKDADAGRLFEAAMASGARRVVVKRPASAPPLGGGIVASHGGKAVRWDVHHASPNHIPTD